MDGGEILDTIGRRLRYIRQKNNMTLTDIKNITGLSTGNLSELENDKFLPSAHALMIFKKIFNVSIDWLLTGEYSPNPMDMDNLNEAKEEYVHSALTDSEIQLIELYRQLDEKEQQNLWGYLNVVSYNKSDRK